MLATTRRTRTAEFCILHNTKPLGPVMGKLSGAAFFEFVEDEFGRLFAYAGIAHRLDDGKFDVAALKEGEFIVMPGLIYAYRGKAGKRKAA